MGSCPRCHTSYPSGVQTCAHDGVTLVDDVPGAAGDRELAVGDAIGDYRVEAKIGEGGFGTVYRAEHTLIGKTALSGLRVG